MTSRLIPESEEFLYWNPETIARYPQPSEEVAADAQTHSPVSDGQAIWRTLSRQGLASLMLGFGAGLFSSALLSLVVLLLGTG